MTATYRITANATAVGYPLLYRGASTVLVEIETSAKSRATGNNTHAKVKMGITAYEVYPKVIL